MINDQTIANFCSDTVRELNNLTEELQHTDLEIGRITNNIVTESNNVNGISQKNGMRFINNDTDLHPHYPINHYGIENSNSLYDYKNQFMSNSRCSNSGDDSDVVDSSRTYTQLSQVNSLKNLGVINDQTVSMKQQQQTDFDATDGDSADNDDDEYRTATYMLQSVDLRGKFSTYSFNSNFFTVNIVLFLSSIRCFTIKVIVFKCSIPLAW